MTSRRSEANLLTTLRSIGDAVISTDERGHIIFMNPVAQELTGWTLEEARGKNLDEVFNIVNEYTREQVESPFARVIRENVAVGLANHTVLISKDGREIPIDDSGAPIKNADGTITGVVLVFHDIMERRRAEDETLKLAAIVESSDDAIFAKTLDGIILSWNAGAQRLYGYTPEEVVGHPVTMLLPPDRPDEVPRILEQLKAGQRVEHFETVRVTKAGEYRNISLTISPIKNQHGIIIGASTIARDITERTRAEKALRESEERFGKAFEASPLALTITSLKTGRLLEVNEIFTRLSGYTREEAVGRTTLELGLWARESDRNTELALVSQRGQVRDVEYPFRIKDGRELIGLLSAELIELGGEPCALTVIQDITEQKRSQAERERLLERERAARLEAEEANRLKDEFLATLSHELRTPLTAMLGWTKMLLTSRFDEKTTQHALETVERNVRAQTQLIEDLLDVSRIVTGKLRIETRPVELVPVIEAALDSIRPAAEAKNIELEQSLDPTSGLVLGDPARLQQIVWNLLSNAVKFTPRGGHARIGLRRDESQIAISVTDTGMGINPEFLPHVFERFRQADSSSTRSHSGLGLGLAIVRHMVELHGGVVHAESEGAGHGATFTVKLPLMAVAPLRKTVEGDKEDGSRARSLESERLPTLQGVRVLLVDDEEDARNLLVTILEQYAADVEAVSNMRHAFASIKRAVPDVLISDIGMPEEDGYELIRRLRAAEESRMRELPAVALTAYAGEGDRTLALASGFQLHLAKPVDPEALVAAIHQLVRKENS